MDECEESFAELMVAARGAGNIACDAPCQPTDLFAFRTQGAPQTVAGW